MFLASSLGVRMMTFLGTEDQLSWLLADRCSFDEVAVHALVEYCATLRNREAPYFPLALPHFNAAERLTDAAAVAMCPDAPAEAEEASAPVAAPVVAEVVAAADANAAEGLDDDDDEGVLSLEELATAADAIAAAKVHEAHIEERIRRFEEALDYVAKLAPLHDVRPAALSANAVAELLLNAFNGQPSLWLDRHCALTPWLMGLLDETPTTAVVVTVTKAAAFWTMDPLWQYFEGALLVHRTNCTTVDAAVQAMSAIHAARAKWHYAVGGLPATDLPNPCRLAYTLGRTHQASTIEYIAGAVMPVVQLGKDARRDVGIATGHLHCDTSLYVPKAAYSRLGGITTAVVDTMSHVKAFKGSFLSDCPNLTSVNLKPLTNVTSLGSNFLANSPVSIVDVNDMKHLRHIGHGFLAGNGKLNQLLLERPLLNVVRIGNDFLRNAGPLVYARLGHLFPNVVSVGSGFCAELSLMATIDIAGMTKLQGVGTDFFADNPVLTDVVLPSLDELEKIPDRFLCNSTVKALNLDTMTSVRRIGHDFLACYASPNSNLTAISFGALQQLRSVGRGLLSYCTALLELNLEAVPLLTSIGKEFLRGCSGLKRLTLPRGWTPSTLPDSFCHGCASLTSIVNLRLCCAKLTAIGHFCLAGCLSLPPLDLSLFANVTSIGHGFLRGSQTITELDFSCMPKLTSVGSSFIDGFSQLTDVVLPASLTALPGPGFLNHCGALRTFDISMWEGVDVLPRSFLLGAYVPEFDPKVLLPRVAVWNPRCFQASGIETLDLDGMSELQEIGAYCFSECTQLRRVTLSRMPKLESVRASVFANCAVLREILLEDLPSLTEVGDNFALDCGHLHSVRIINTPSLIEIGETFLNSLPQLRNKPFRALAAVASPSKGGWGAPSTIDFSGLAAMPTVPEAFLMKSGIARIDLSCLMAVTAIEDNVLRGCESLLELIVNLPNLTAIGSNFAAQCGKLERVRLATPVLNKVGPWYLHESAVFADADFFGGGLRSIRTMGKAFCRTCNIRADAAPTVVSHMPLLTCLPDECFKGALLVRIELADLPNLTAIGVDAFSSMPHLESAVVRRLPQLASIGERFCAESAVLTCLEVTEVPNLTQIDSGCLSGCPALARVTLEAPALHRIGKSFGRSGRVLGAFLALDLSSCVALTTIEDPFLPFATNLLSFITPPSLVVDPASGLAGMIARIAAQRGN